MLYRDIAFSLSKPLGNILGIGGGTPPWGDEVRTVRYINTLGAGDYLEPVENTTQTWAAGNNGNSGASVSAPWLTLANIASLSAGSYIVFINASADNTAPATHTLRLIIPSNVDAVLVPVTTGAVLKTGGTSQARCFDISNPSAFIRLRRGRGNAAFRIDCAAMSAAGSATGGVFRVDSTTGTYGLEIDGAHTVFDSAAATFERLIVSSNVPTLYNTTPASAPTGTPTFIFKNGFKVVGEDTYIRGIHIGHLGTGSVTVDGLDFAGTTRIASTGTTPIPRDLTSIGLLTVSTASAGATVNISNTYGELIPSLAATFCGIKVFDCAVTASNLAHSLQCTTGSSVKPTWFGGYNVDNTATVTNYNCTITGSATTPSGIVFVAGDDGKAQPRLSLSQSTTGAGVTCYAEWAFFTAGDVGKVILPPSGTGKFTIDAFVDARRVTGTVNTAFSGGVTMTAFRLETFTVDEYEWRIGNKMIGGSITGGTVAGPDIAASTIHGIFAGGCADFTIADMDVSYMAPAVAHKDSLRCIATGNTTRNVPVYSQHLVSKGATSSEFNGNTCYLSSTNAYEGGGLRASSNDYDEASTLAEFTDNTLYISDAAYAGAYLAYIESGSDATMDGNHWIMQDSGAVPSKFNYSGLTGRTFAQYVTDVAPTDYSTP